MRKLLIPALLVAACTKDAAPPQSPLASAPPRAADRDHDGIADEDGDENALEPPEATEAPRHRAVAASPPRDTATRPRPDLRARGPSVDEVWILARAPRAAATEPRVAPGLRAEVEGREVPLPLARTDVRAKISGFLATVEVRQRYDNPYDRKIDVEYVFPLPANAAVSEFIMTVGARRIRGIVRERAEAEELYREARRQGYVASLLTEERPNVFTQKVANIEPGKQIDIALTYDNTLPWEDGAFTFAFPTVVGPRYNRAGSRDGVGAAQRGSAGASGQPTEVTYLAPDETSRHRVSFTIELDAGAPLVAVDSATHALDQKIVSDHVRRIAVADAAPDRDLVLRYRVASRPAVFVHQGADGATSFALLLPPPADLRQLARAPVEMVFVVDCSGSMDGLPIAVAKRAVRQQLARLGPADTFQIIQFSMDASALGRAPVPATPDNVARGLAYLASLRGEGGTEMITGIRAALDFSPDPQRLRVVSFLTDGYIGDERDILAAVAAKVGSARLFSFGVGTAVNRYLLEKMAAFGRGAVAFVDLGERAPEEAAALFYERVSHPALADVSVDWGAWQVSDVYPERIPDLMVGRPIVVVGRARGPLPASVEVRGVVGGRRVSYKVPLGPAAEHPALAKLWARARVGHLADAALLARDPAAIVEEVKRVALTHGLLSAYTAFIAVDATEPTGGGTAPIVPVSVPVPRGVNAEKSVPR
ncbi:MAG TPA: VIT domain-containing protein [Haliangiales bacterium]|nr:VIT domain-containing protein [Haliangiales bacterium]